MRRWPRGLFRSLLLAQSIAWPGLAAVGFSALALSTIGCARAAPPAVDPVLAARQAGAESRDGEVIGKWLLAELVAPGGSREQAVAARARLDDVARDQQGVYASLARGLDDETHGALKKAAAAYLAGLEASRSHVAPENELLAWYTTSRLLFLRGNVADLWATAKGPVERLIADPGRIGWRARSDLVSFWRFDTRSQSAGGRRTIDEEAGKQLGCLKKARFAGPFGRPAPLDVVTAFAPEKPGAWPSTFGGEALRPTPPRVFAGERGDSVCSLRAVSTGAPGVYYLESFFSLEHATDVLISVKSALSLRLDDVEVLAHDPRAFATWSKTAVLVRLQAGSHRIVARLMQPESVVSLLGPSGQPIDVTELDPAVGAAALEPPRMLPDPHVLTPFAASVEGALPPVAATDTRAPVPAHDPVLRFMAAELAHVDGLDDLATVLAEPLVKEPSRATPIALAEAATFIESDPIFSENDARDLALDHRRRALEKDARLWYSQLWLSLDAASKQGEKDQLVPLAQLALDFPEVPAVGRALAALYAKLGYRPEQKRTILDLAKRFPNDAEILRSLVSVLDEEGNRAEADRVAARIAQLDLSSTLEIERLVGKGDLAGAAKLVEARAEGAVGQAKRQSLRRITDLLVRAGQRRETLELLEQALASEPGNTRAALDLADARVASGDHAALRRALADSLQKGVETAELRDAIEVVDGATELEPFRKDARAAILEFESSGAAKAGLAKKKGGTAARVLDYATVWVHADGSGRMLEHEILHMQSNEAIAEHAEQKLPRGKLLRIRTIKANGEVFEPEIVANKPTATMPHLDVGDYIETETIYEIPSDGRGGKSFVSPRWFFREEKIDYHRSEFVIVAPNDKPLAIETTGAVPAPEITKPGPFVVYRWRVDKSPALPNERFGAPISEYLPSVRAGWGISQNDVLERLLDASTRLTPADPRLIRIAKTIATVGARPEEQDAELAKTSYVDRAQRIYRWVLDNVEPSREVDPRKSIVGKAGSRLEAFLYLTRLVGVDARHAMVQDRLQPKAIGPISEAELFTEVAVAIPDEKGNSIWTLVDDKYAPFGYMPSSMRGQPAVILRPDLPRVVTGKSGPPDGVSHEGKVVLAADGSGKLTIKQSYSGRLGILLREQIQKIPDDERLKTAIESQLLPEGLPGARVAKLSVENLENLDEPLVLALELEVSSLARRDGAILVMAPPFASSVRLAALTSLEQRETPLLVPGQLAMRLEVKLTLELPKGAKLEGALAPLSGENDGRTYKVDDRADGSTVTLNRVIDIPAGRVQPADYATFVAFARAADEAFHRDLTIRLP